MNTKKFILLSLIFICGLFSNTILPSTFTSNNFQVTFSLDSSVAKNDWGTGCQAVITIKNTGTTQIQSWVLDFDLLSSDQTAGNIWGGVKDTTLTQGSHVRVSNPTYWHGGYIEAGASTKIGLIINKKNTTAGIKNVTCATTAALLTTSSNSQSTPSSNTTSPDSITNSNTPATNITTPASSTNQTAPSNTTSTGTASSTSSSKSNTSTTSQPKVIGYFPNWLIYQRQNNTQYPTQAQDRPVFTPDNIDIATSQLTHVYFAFAKPYMLSTDVDSVSSSLKKICTTPIKATESTKNLQYKVSIMDPWADVCSPGDGSNGVVAGHFKKLQDLKSKNPHIKTVISIGGWTIYNQGMPAVKFSLMAQTATLRKTFIDSAIAFARKYGFDGIDIDWEYPAFNGGKPNDTQNYTLFLQEFRTAINNEAATKNVTPLTLSIAAPAGIDKMKAIEISKIHPYVDWINLMTYDFNGSPWSTYASHNTPLYAPAQGDNPNFNIDYAVQYYLQQGVPASKLILGMALYGRSFGKVPTTQVVPGLPGVFNTYNGVGSSVTDDSAGYQSWPNIKNKLLATNSGYTRYWDDTAKVPYLYNQTTQDLISYDDDQSLGVKAQYAKTNGLGGAMFWQLENDSSIWNSIGNVQKILTNGQSTGQTNTTPTPSTSTPTTNTTNPTNNTTTNSSILSVTSAITDNWKTGYQGTITIKNTGTTDIYGWTLTFDFNSPEQKLNAAPCTDDKTKTCYSIWAGTLDPSYTSSTQKSHVIFSNQPAGTLIATGKSISLGFVATKDSASTAGIKNVICNETPSTIKAPGQITPFVAPKTTTPITPGKYKVVGYFPNWLIYPRANTAAFPTQSQDRPKFNPLAIDVVGSKLTHICFAFAKPYTLGKAYDGSNTTGGKYGDPDCFANMDPAQDNFGNMKFNNDYWNSGIRSYKVSIVDPYCDTFLPMKYADNFAAGTNITDPYDGNTYTGHLAALRAVKAKYPGLKTIISIGGWTIYNQGTPAAKFSTMIEQASTRKEFIDSALLFTKKYGFDGIDIDFEYPAYQTNGGKAADTQNYTIFLKEFREALNTWNSTAGNNQLTLSIAAPAGITNMKNIEIAKIHQYVDWIYLMTYDFNGDWASTTGHNAPLTAPMYNGKCYGDGVDRSGPNPTFYSDYAVQYYLKQGVPAEKLVLGMPLYGRSFANAAATEIVPGYPGLYNSFDHTISGSQVTDDGRSYQSWPNVKTKYLDPSDETKAKSGSGYTRYWDAQAQVPYLFNPNYKNPNIPSAKTDLITYDDNQSLKIKAEYVKKNKLGGAMFWQLENAPDIWKSIGVVGATLSN